MTAAEEQKEELKREETRWKNFVPEDKRRPPDYNFDLQNFKPLRIE